VITPEEAQDALNAARSARIQKCHLAIRAVLEEHRCDFDVSVELRLGKVTPQISLVAKD
jgi:hypothetical protein